MTFVFLIIFCIVILPLSIAFLVSIEWLEVLAQAILPIFLLAGILIYAQKGVWALITFVLSILISFAAILYKIVSDYEAKEKLDANK